MMEGTIGLGLSMPNVSVNVFNSHNTYGCKDANRCFAVLHVAAHGSQDFIKLKVRLDYQTVEYLQ